MSLAFGDMGKQEPSSHSKPADLLPFAAAGFAGFSEDNDIAE
jgi:hypothetical protein